MPKCAVPWHTTKCDLTSQMIADADPKLRITAIFVPFSIAHRDDISPLQKGSVNPAARNEVLNPDFVPLVIGTLVKWSSLCCPCQAWSRIVSDV